MKSKAALAKGRGKSAQLSQRQTVTRRHQQGTRVFVENASVSEFKFQSVLEQSYDGIVLIDEQGSIIEWNTRQECITGLVRGNVLGKSIWDIQLQLALPEYQTHEFRMGLRKRIEQALRERQAPWFNQVREIEIRRADNTRRIIETFAYPIHFGEHFAIGSVMRDVTERKRVQASLQASEERYRNLIDISPDAIVIHQQGRMVYVNSAGAKLFGARDPQELVDKPILDIVHPAYRELVSQRIEQTINGQNVPSFEHQIVRLDGTVLYVEVAAIPFNYQGRPATQMIVRDVTQRKRAEETLRESEARFRAVVESATDAVITIDSRGIVNFWNKAAKNIFGYSEEEILGKSPTMLMRQDYRVRFEDGIAKLALWGERRKMGRFTEMHGLRKDGSEFPLEYSLTTWQTREGQFFTAMLRDITTQKANQRALSESETRYRFLFEVAPVGIGMIDLAGNVMAANQTLQKITGYSPDEFKTAQVVFNSVDFDFESLVRILSDSGKILDWEACLKRRDGTEYTGLLNLHLIEMGEHQGVFISVQDITERKQAEQEVRLRAAEFAGLYVTATSLAQQRDLPTLLRLIVENAMEHLNADAGLICFYDAKQEDLYLADQKNLNVPIGARLKLGEGIIGAIAETRQALIVNEYQTNKSLSLGYAELPMVPAMIAPILYGKELLAVICVLQTEHSTRKFGEPDQRFLMGFAPEAASALYNARLFQEVNAHAEQLTLLYDAGLTLNQVLNPHEQLRLLLEIAVKALHATRAEFFRYDVRSNSLHYELSGGSTEKSIDVEMRAQRFPMGEPHGLVGWVAQQRTPVYLPDVSLDPRWITADPQIRSSLCVPVEHEDRLLGVLTVVSNRLDAFTTQNEWLLVLFASQVAVAMESARMYEETRRRAETLEVLNGAALHIQHRLDKSEVLKIACEELRRFGTFASAFLVEDSSLEHIHTSMSPELLGDYVATFGEKEIELSIPLEAVAPAWGQSQAGQTAIEHGMLPHIISLMSPPSRPVGEWLYAKSGQGSVLFAPLTQIGGSDGNETIGVMVVIGDKLNESDIPAVALFARHVSIAMEHAQFVDNVAEIKALRELDRLRSELIANVSHELRTPLGLIKLLCSNLLREDVQFPKTEQQEFLKEIEEESDKLERIVSNLLDLSRMQNGRFQIDKYPTNLNELISHVIDSMAAQGKHHRFMQDLSSVPITAQVDAKRIEQVLRNLLSNAIKYSPQGGTITVHAVCDAEDVLIEISDRGIGIAPSDLARIFERFYRADNDVTRRVSGVGLGLAICREIVQAHGGNIWVESTPNLGSTFSFTLPIAID
ncbi:MAG: PAS domain S-box protein [Chloroflexi bacterium]|nr:PAS domain S-box protein [Chloroflexota bacterium]